MIEENNIVNRVANSGLITLNLEDYYHAGERMLWDIAPHLFQGLLLREKDFRDFIKQHDWAQYEGKNIAITCSADAIVPTWAYMLLATQFEPYAHRVVFGELQTLEQTLFQEAIAQIDKTALTDAKVIIKGCNKYDVPVFAYTELAYQLKPYVSSLMFGEACSNVPLYKKKASKKVVE